MVDATPLASGYQRRTAPALEEVTVVRHHPPNGLHEDRRRNCLAKRMPRNPHSHLGLQQHHGGAVLAHRIRPKTQRLHGDLAQVHLLCFELARNA